MANYNKAFNFRGGFQVDEDTFLVRGRNVGIGSSVPSERLDVDGIIKTRGLIVDSTDVVAITTAYVGVLSAKTVQSGIFTGTPENSGLATYYGDGRYLLGLPTSQWVDVDVGLGYTSIYAAGNVGVDTIDPRYKFQVGGVPFKTKTGPFVGAQDGVGIEDGDIYFSGIVSARYKPDAEKQGFVGYASFLNTLNASELTTGSIPSYSYGDLIITEEVIAPKLTGIASTAIGVTTDAQLSFDTAVANDITANNSLSVGNTATIGGDVVVGGGLTVGNKVKAAGGFISTEGYLQIGVDEDISTRGDIEVIKDTEDAKVYVVSASGDAEVLVGKQRPGGSNRQFGGIRAGLVPSDPLSGEGDLDLVNYDVGNLNYYLHSGSGGQGATEGSFRWLYGQRDVVLMDLDRDGVLTLPPNTLVSGPLFSVGGETELLGDVTIGDDSNLNVTGIASFFGDVYVSGNITLSELSIAGVVTFTAVDTDRLLVATDPTSGGGGTLIEENYAHIAGIVTVSVITNKMTVEGSVDAIGVNCTEVDVSRLTINESISGPGSFNVTSGGVISGFSVNITSDSTFGGVVGFNDLTANNITAPSAVIDSLETDLIQSREILVDNLGVSTSFTASSVQINDINCANLVSSAGTFTALNVQALNAETIVGVGTTATTKLFTTIDGVNSGIIQGMQSIQSFGPVFSDTGRYSSYNGGQFMIEYQVGVATLGIVSSIILNIFNPAGDFVGETILPLASNP